MPFHQIGHKWPLFGMFTQYLLKYNYEIVVRLIFCKFWAFDFFRPNSSKLVQTRLLLNQKWKKLIWVFFLLNFSHWFQFWVLKKPKMINKAVSFSLCTWRKFFFVKLSFFINEMSNIIAETNDKFSHDHFELLIFILAHKLTILEGGLCFGLFMTFVFHYWSVSYYCRN